MKIFKIALLALSFSINIFALNWVGSYDTPGYAHGVAVSGNYACPSSQITSGWII